MDKELLNELYVKNDLNPSEDIHTQHSRSGKEMFKIITRSGIEKIQAKNGFNISMEIVQNEVKEITDKNGGHVKFAQFVAVKATGYNALTDSKVETFGEATPYNTTQNYPMAIAEKRALSRCVLKLAGMYKHGFFGEDEADEFKKTVQESKSNQRKEAFVNKD